MTCGFVNLLRISLTFFVLIIYLLLYLAWLISVHHMVVIFFVKKKEKIKANLILVMLCD